MVQQLRCQGSTFSALTCDWSTSKGLGIHNRCLRSVNKSLTCGKILSHAKQQVSALRESVGVRLCCFKVGVTHNPFIRFSSYVQKGYTVMWLVWMSSSRDIVHMLEASLISEFGRHVGCHNEYGTGGEGALNKADPPDPPYFVYVVAGRADQHRNVG